MEAFMIIHVEEATNLCLVHMWVTHSGRPQPLGRVLVPVTALLPGSPGQWEGLT